MSMGALKLTVVSQIMLLFSAIYQMPKVTSTLTVSDNGSPEACTADPPYIAMSLCICIRNQGGFFVDCPSGRLKLIPRIPNTTTELYVRRHRIQQLSNHQFNEAKMLTVIDLSHNVITTIPTTAFSGLSSLVTLDLSYNNLKYISFQLTSLKQIQYLKFSNNNLEQFSESTINEIDDLVAKHSREISIDLSGNQLRCDCDTIPFMKWRLKTEINFLFNDTYMCTLANGTTRPFNQNLRDLVKQLDQDCTTSNDALNIIIIVLLLFSTVLALWIFQYCLRKQVKTLIRRITLDVQRNAELIGEPDEHDDYTYTYDAFISYENEDHAVARSECILELEEKRELRLCVHERDFVAGENIGDSIYNAISNSKRVALFVSRKFLTSYWCLIELDVARFRAVQVRRKLILIVMLEDIPACEQNAQLLYITSMYTYLKYTNGDEHEKTDFWDKVADFINGPSRLDR